MSTEDISKRVYTGSETNVQYLQQLFAKSGIHSRTRNDFDSGRMAGFGGGMRGQVQLFVDSSSYNDALNIAKATFPEDYEHEQE